MKHARCENLCRHLQAALDVLARPWNGLILATLEEGPLRFGEVAERVTGIGDRMLSERLKELEARGVVAREVEPGPPVRITYALTRTGQGFRAVADSAARWGEQLERVRPANKRTPRARAG